MVSFVMTFTCNCTRLESKAVIPMKCNCYSRSLKYSWCAWRQGELVYPAGQTPWYIRGKSQDTGLTTDVTSIGVAVICRMVMQSVGLVTHKSLKHCCNPTLPNSIKHICMYESNRSNIHMYIHSKVITIQ